MNEALKNRLETLLARHEELERMLADVDIASAPGKMAEYSKEYAQLDELSKTFSSYQQESSALLDLVQLLSIEKDQSMRQLLKEEESILTEKRQETEEKLQALLLPQDPNDQRNVYLEIRAGAGGDEAAIFAGDLFRMYVKFAETQHWRLEVVTQHEAEQGGFKEIITKISGQGVYACLKFESGAHRVQRVPVTEAQGRVHTSTCTVAVLPEVEAIDSVDISNADLRIDTYRASGAGGQHVNKTESAIRLTHIPTGIVVECQDERSQHKNRAKAFALLQSKILAGMQEEQRLTQAATRKSLVGTGDRSERIRTYNFPQGRITDHRISLTLYKLDEVMAGGLDEVIQPLLREQQAMLLADLAT